MEHVGPILAILGVIVGAVYSFSRLENRISTVEGMTKVQNRKLNRIENVTTKMYYKLFGDIPPVLTEEQEREADA